MADTSSGRPRRVLFVGSKAVGLAVLQLLHDLRPQVLAGALTLDDRTDPRSVHDRICAYCREVAIELAVAGSRKEADAHVAALRPDLCIVVGWYWLIAEPLLAAVRHGWIGVHNSMLPRYRGGSPLVWQMINGERRAGFSIFSFTPGMDDGPVWAQDSVAIEANDHVGDVLAKLEVATLDSLGRVYPAILDGTMAPAPQGSDGVSYCAQRYPEDGVIDWQQPADAVFDFIRAQSAPYPGAYTQFEGRRLTVWRARRFAAPYHGAPGRVARIDDEGVIVCCGRGSAIRLGDVECETYRGPAQGLIRSVKHRLGA